MFVPSKMLLGLLLFNRNLFLYSNSVSFNTYKNIKMKKDNYDLKVLSSYYKPKSYNQEQYCKYLNDSKNKLIFAIGPAGCGKTLLACNNAIKELKTGQINKIVITRPVVPVDEDIGFLPGNINKKMDPWIKPIFDVFLDFFSQSEINLMVQNGIIEISPLAYMRGRTFKKSYIIADEMQNSSPNQMLMLTTRIGSDSKMVITGDLKQSDKGFQSGLSDFINKYKIYERNFSDVYNTTDINIGIKIIEMNNTDIERSPIIIKILDIYNVKEESNKVIEKVVEKGIKININETVNNSISLDINNDAAMIPLNYYKNKFIK